MWNRAKWTRMLIPTGKSWASVLIALALLFESRLASPDSLVGECGDPATFVHTVQGAVRSSPLLRGEIEPVNVVVEAVIVGWFPGFPLGLGGFFLQEEDEDADDDPRTSEGLFVFDTVPRSAVALGDVVRVRGQVREFFGLTELSPISDLIVCPNRGTASPARIQLPLEDEALWEQWEGMRVEFDQRLVVTGQHNLGRFGEVDLAANMRLEQATQTREPGDPALEFLDVGARSRLLLDDGSEAVDPEPVPYLDRIDAGTLRLGDALEHLEGVLDYGFGRFRLQPLEPVRFLSGNARPAMPPEMDGTLRVVTWNLENHMNGDGRGGGFPTRGPRNVAELDRQRAKLTETLMRLDPDIATLVELENDGTGPESALGQLVTALNDRMPGSPYEAIHPVGTRLGRHPIAVGILYRRDAVLPVGPPRIIDARAHPDFDDARNRPSLVQTFQTSTTRESLTVAVNHFKSKGSSCDSAGDPDLGDGQGECNGTRTRAARAVVEWLETASDHDPGVPVLLTGDLNAYPSEDPLRSIESAGYVDLVARFAGPSAHTFVFDGRAGRLDYLLGSTDLMPFVGGAAVWSTNADEPEVFDYRLENPPELYKADAFRASDHDPVLVGLFPDVDGDGLTDARDRCPRSLLSQTVIVVDCDSGVPDRLDETGCSLTDDLLALGDPNDSGESPIRPVESMRDVNEQVTSWIDQGDVERRHRGAILACFSQAR